MAGPKALAMAFTAEPLGLSLLFPSVPSDFTPAAAPKSVCSHESLATDALFKRPHHTAMNFSILSRLLSGWQQYRGKHVEYSQLRLLYGFLRENSQHFPVVG